MSELYLVATTDKLRFSSSQGASSAIKVSGSYADYNATTGAFAGAAPFRAALAAADTDVVAGPGGSNFRSVRGFTARNTSTTNSDDLTISDNNNGTIGEKYKVTLQPGDSMYYAEGVGYVYVPATQSLLDKNMILTSDYTNSTVTFSDITGLTCALKSGIRYSVLAVLEVLTAVGTTGAQIAYNIGATPTLALFGGIETATPSTSAAAMTAGSQATKATAIVAQGTGPTTAAPRIIGGVIQPSADGTFALQGASEVAASQITVKAGSYLRIWQER